ncbi:MAG: glycosyl hydrolase family 95 catalytic domain-containing protein [Lachnospirales bacterium]
MYKGKVGAEIHKDKNEYFLEFTTPATSWSDSFLMGDGHLGAAVYGGIENETIELSHNTFFSGEKQHLKRENAPKAFQSMRENMILKNYDKAVEVADDFIGIRGNYGTHLPVGNLKIDFTTKYSNLKYKFYSRKLNIFNAIGEVNSVVDNIKVEVEFFINHADHSLYYYFNCGSQRSCEIYFENLFTKNKTYKEDEQYFFEIQALEKIHSDNKHGVKLKGSAVVFDCDGEIHYTHDCIKITNFKKFVLRVVTDTNFDIESETLLSKINEDVFETALFDYEKIKEEHIKDIGNYMKRLEVSFNGNDDLSEFMLQYGRYLLLSSSREDSMLPASLQGIWNDNVACQIGWTCDMHLDINTQMNYWLSESGNLQESHNPIFNWMERILIPSGRKTARDYYGMSGWSADLVSNAWGYSHPYWSKTISPCPTSGVWLASDYIEHYKYTKNMEFLNNRAFKVIEEAVEFFLDYIFINGEKYSVGPSISPENSYIHRGKRYYFLIDSTYEKLMIYELFQQYLYLTNERNIKGKYTDKINKIIFKFPIYHIGQKGNIMEFNKEYKEYDAQHRHTSHLLGLYPYRQITNKVLKNASYESIKERLVHYENWEDTGWARSLLILYMARLNEGDKAYWHIQEMYKNLLNPNYLVIHPPTREAPSFKEVYELDGNTGVAMGIIEMLIQSTDEYIELLPSITKEWKTGYLKGVKAYGNLEIDMYWKDFRVIKLNIKSKENKSVNFIINKTNINLSLNKGMNMYEL